MKKRKGGEKIYSPPSLGARVTRGTVTWCGDEMRRRREVGDEDSIRLLRSSLSLLLCSYTTTRSSSHLLSLPSPDSLLPAPPPSRYLRLSRPRSPPSLPFSAPSDSPGADGVAEQ